MISTNLTANLLDSLAKEVGCSCLSDLRESRYRTRLLRVISAAKAESYPLKQWQECAYYLLLESVDLTAASQVQTYILQQLKQV